MGRNALAGLWELAESIGRLEDADSSIDLIGTINNFLGLQGSELRIVSTP